MWSDKFKSTKVFSPGEQQEWRCALQRCGGEARIHPIPYVARVLKEAARRSAEDLHLLWRNEWRRFQRSSQQWGSTFPQQPLGYSFCLTLQNQSRADSKTLESTRAVFPSLGAERWWLNAVDQTDPWCGSLVRDSTCGSNERTWRHFVSPGVRPFKRASAELMRDWWNEP